MEGDPDSGLACTPNDADIQPWQCLRPDSTTLNRLVTAYATSPVLNPDGSRGISLHYDIDNSFPFVWNFDWSMFTQNFDSTHTGLYHHAIRIASWPSCECGGMSWGDRFNVIGGNEDQYPSDSLSQSAIFIHELGHNLRLNHGGTDWDPWKANYLSAMGYIYNVVTSTLRGIPYQGTDRLDYSRFCLEDLDETNLNEAAGMRVVGGGFQSDLNGYGAFILRCSVDSAGVFHIDGYTEAANAGSDVDWDGDGDSTEISVSADINCNLNQTSVLSGCQRDWWNMGYTNLGPIPVVPPPSPVSISGRGRNTLFSYPITCPLKPKAIKKE